jgi:DNA-damage-inducible protein D
MDAKHRLARNREVADDLQQAATAGNAGLVTARDFAIFTDAGYMGLYNGERAKDIHARKGLKKNQQILDWMGAEELGDNLFRQLQAEARLRREGVTNPAEANRIHHETGAAVRDFILNTLGGSAPEQLPTPTESIQQVRRREEQRLARER